MAETEGVALKAECLLVHVLQHWKNDIMLLGTSQEILELGVVQILLLGGTLMALSEYVDATNPVLQTLGNRVHDVSLLLNIVLEYGLEVAPLLWASHLGLNPRAQLTEASRGRPCRTTARRPRGFSEACQKPDICQQLSLVDAPAALHCVPLRLQY